MKAISDTPAVLNKRSVRDHLAASRALVDRTLAELLPSEGSEPASVHSAVRWSLLAGGKRFRPALLLSVGETFGATEDDLLHSACAVEMIHTYSLIHDDLPAMDDDELRRGRPTCHVRFGEATAILAGDVLQTLAFQTVAEDDRLTPETRVRVVAELARASGTPGGMVAGQALDLAAESRDVTVDELETIHRLKTGALIVGAARAGAVIAAVDDSQLRAVTEYASALGLLFQITDDLLDVTASAEALGKTPGKDARSSKATYPALYGLEATVELARKTHTQACTALNHIDGSDLLRAIADFILERQG